MDITNPTTGCPHPWYTFRSVGEAGTDPLKARLAAITDLLADGGEGLHAGYRLQLRTEGDAIKQELSNRWEAYCKSKSDPYDQAHGLDRD